MKPQNVPTMSYRKSRTVAGQQPHSTEPEHNVVRHPQSLCEDPHARIAARAYELYVERGRRDGMALDDWLDAEHEIQENNHADSRHLGNSSHPR